MTLSTVVFSMLVRRKLFEQSANFDSPTQNVLAVKAWLGDNRLQ